MTVHKTPAVTATARKTRDLDADLLIIPVFEDDSLSDEPDLDRASGGEYGGARQRREFTGKPFEQLFTPLAEMDGSPAAHCGSAPRPEGPHHRAPPAGRDHRRALCASAAVREHRDRITSRRRRRARARVQALVEGAVLANYEGMSYKTANQPVAWLERVELRVVGDVDEAAVERQSAPWQVHVRRPLHRRLLRRATPPARAMRPAGRPSCMTSPRN